MVREKDMGLVRPSHQLLQVEEVFLDSHLITEIFGNGHDVAKADTKHGRLGLVDKVHGVPFYEIYDRLDGMRRGKSCDDEEDFSQLAAQMQGL